MPCDRSDCQPEANSIAQSRRLRAVIVIEGRQSDLSPSTQGMIVFITHTESLSFTHLIYICTLCSFKTQKLVIRA